MKWKYTDQHIQRWVSRAYRSDEVWLAGARVVVGGGVVSVKRDGEGVWKPATDADLLALRLGGVIEPRR